MLPICHRPVACMGRFRNGDTRQRRGYVRVRHDRRFYGCQPARLRDTAGGSTLFARTQRHRYNRKPSGRRSGKTETYGDRTFTTRPSRNFPSVVSREGRVAFVYPQVRRIDYFDITRDGKFSHVRSIGNLSCRREIENSDIFSQKRRDIEVRTTEKTYTCWTIMRYMSMTGTATAWPNFFPTNA